MTVHLEGTIAQGKAIDTASAGELVPLPDQLTIDPGDQLFRAGSEIADLGILAGDFLLVEPRKGSSVQTGEAVIVIAGGLAFAGRWWQKQGRRALMNDQLSPIVEGGAMKVFGAITLILRHSRQARKSTWRISNTSARSPTQLIVHSLEKEEPPR